MTRLDRILAFPFDTGLTFAVIVLAFVALIIGLFEGGSCV